VRQLNQPISKSALSKGQARLVELLQNLNFGRIEGLRVKAGEPTFEPAPRIVRKLKLGADNSRRPEAALEDFPLKQQTIEMLEAITWLRDGEVLSIEVKHGLAFAMEVEQRSPNDGDRRG
jgi:hypothetical protein